jgi:hypothetical protein
MVERTAEHDPPERVRQATAQHAGVSHARLTLLAVAGTVGAFDLLVKLIEPTQEGLYHRRTYGELLLILAISAAALYFVPLARSRSIAVGAGLMIGGGIGNALSIAVSPQGVPNPLVLSRGEWAIAFNLADICVLAGFLVLLLAVMGVAFENRDELRKPIER